MFYADWKLIWLIYVRDLALLQALSKNTGKIGQSTLLEEINILKYGAKRTLDTEGSPRI